MPLFLHNKVEDEYERWRRLVGDEDPYCSQYTVGLHEVLRAHFLIVDLFYDDDYGIGGVGPKSLDLLHSAIYRQFVSLEGKEKWPGVYEKCATLIFGIIKDHAFHDANKRTAFLTALYQLDKIKRIPSVSYKEFEDFFVEIADNKLENHRRYKELLTKVEDPEIVFISEFLQKRTRKIDKRPYTITFHDLQHELKKYGFELANPSGNHIDLIKIEYRPKHLGLFGSEVRKEIRVAQIGFPGWKNQVGKGAIRTVLESAKLTPENGYDSKTFFQGADPLHALIDMYSGPLRRLADR